MATEIRNTSVDPLTLPSPLRGVLRGGQAIVLSSPRATLLALIPSLSPSFLVVDLGSSYPGLTDDEDFGPDPDASTARARVASTANLTLSAAQTIDGVAVVAGNVVLVKNQSTASQNGLYICRAGAWERSPLLPVGASAAGFQVLVEEGTANADITFLCTNNVGSDVVGTSNLVFASGAVVDALLVHRAGAETITGVKTFSVGPNIAPVVSASGTPTQALIVSNAADLLITASTEAPSVFFNIGASRQWATGAITSQREIRFTAPTYTFVGASTITNAATIYIHAAPIAGTNATITNSYALWVGGGTTRLDGNLTVGGVASASAALAVNSTTQGLLFPRMTEVERDAISAPAAGLVIYNTTTNKLNLRVAAAWEIITSV